MRILHVVPYVSREAAFGGPVSVCVQQCSELARRGYDVTIAYGWDGSARPLLDAGLGTKELRFRAFRLSRSFGPSWIVSLRLNLFLFLNCKKFDVVHIHYGRDLVSQPAGLLVRNRSNCYFVQTHGMTPDRDSMPIKLLDWLSTTRVLTGAANVFSLTDMEDGQLERLGVSGNVCRLRNGVEWKDFVREDRLDGVVLFCSRLHSRKRPAAFVDMASILIANGNSLSFRIIGPDEGQLDAVMSAVQQYGIGDRVEYLGALPHHEVEAELSKATVLVLPSISEPFPMIALEALACGTPVVITDKCGISNELSSMGAALVTDGSAEALADAVCTVVDDDNVRISLRLVNETLAKQVYGIDSVIDSLLDIYKSRLP